MEQPKIIYFLPIFLKFGTFLDVKTRRLNETLVYGRLFFTACLTLYIGFTIYDDVLRNKNFAKTHDFLICVIILFYETDFVKSKEQVLGVVEFLLQAFPNYASTDPYRAEITIYNKEVKSYGRLIVGLSLIYICWSLSPLLLLLFFYPGTTVYETFNIPMSSVARSETYLCNVLAITVPVIILVSGVLHFYAWYPLIMYSVLKIKLIVRMLIVDLVTMDERLAHEARDILDIMIFLPLCGKCRLGRQGCWSATAKDVGDCCREACRQSIERDCLKLFLSRIVESHIHIIEMVRLVDRCFNRSVMLYNKAAVLAAVVFIPKLSIRLEPTQYFNSGFEVLGALACIGIFNWCGQQVLNESDKLHRALYECSWLNKYPKVRKHFLLMMTISTRPLRLTAGRINTLSMELYFSILNATYSYASLMQSVKY